MNCIREVAGSNLGWDTDYLDCGLSCLSSVPTENLRSVTYNCVTTLPSPPFLIHCHHRIIPRIGILIWVRDIVVKENKNIWTINNNFFYSYLSRDSSVGTAMGSGWTAGFRFLAGARFLSSPQRPDRLWGPASLYSTGAVGSFPEGKAAGEWIWPFTSIYCRGQQWWSYTFKPPYVFMA
jgi:hypothetical protein